MSEMLDAMVKGLQGDERVIALTLLSRLNQGRREYGSWDLHDERDYPAEALSEVIDALHYCATEMVRIKRNRSSAQDRLKRIFVCYPFYRNPKFFLEKTVDICRSLLFEGVLPVNPYLYFSGVVDLLTEEDLATTLSLELVAICDELYVYSDNVTPVMTREIDRAKALGIPIRYMEEVC